MPELPIESTSLPHKSPRHSRQLLKPLIRNANAMRKQNSTNPKNDKEKNQYWRVARLQRCLFPPFVALSMTMISWNPELSIACFVSCWTRRGIPLSSWPTWWDCCRPSCCKRTRRQRTERPWRTWCGSCGAHTFAPDDRVLIL